MEALKWGLRVLVLNCPPLPTIVIILRRRFTSHKGPEGLRPQKCTIADDYARVAACGLKPPFKSPDLDFPPDLVWPCGTIVEKCRNLS